MIIQLKKVENEDATEVGTLAKLKFKLIDMIAQPFQLILTHQTIEKLFSDADILQEKSQKPESEEGQVELFKQVTEKLQAVQFDPETTSQLREYFELLTLDANNLRSLSQLSEQKSILVISPSLSYERSNKEQRIFFANNNFYQFIETIKSILASIFTPQAIKERKEQNITSWNVALLAYKLPELQTCIEVTRNKEESVIKTYVGFPDIRKEVQKDTFKVSGLIPQITHRTIVQQKEVCIFNMEQNQVISKAYYQQSSPTQNVTDQDVLEAVRLTNKISKLHEQEILSTLFIKSKQGSLLLLDVNPYQEQKAQEEEKKESSIEEKRTIVQTIAQLVQALERDIILDSPRGQIDQKITTLHLLLDELDQLD